MIASATCLWKKCDELKTHVRILTEKKKLQNSFSMALNCSLFTPKLWYLWNLYPAGNLVLSFVFRQKMAKSCWDKQRYREVGPSFATHILEAFVLFFYSNHNPGIELGPSNVRLEYIKYYRAIWFISFCQYKIWFNFCFHLPFVSFPIKFCGTEIER